MKLSLEQIRQVTVGALRVTEEADGIHFYKCTEKQSEGFYRMSDSIGYRSRATTGVRLDFHTNSKKMSFGVSQGVKFEVLVNGLLRTQFDTSKEQMGSVELNDPLGDPYTEEVRVTLVFPSHNVIGILKYVELDDGATLSPHKFDRKILFIGDSITQGWASEYDSLSYAYRVSRYFNANSLIQGIGAAYYFEDTFDHLDFDPDVVFVAYGTNDFYVSKSKEEFEAHVKAHLGLLAKEYAGKKFFVISPIWREHRDGMRMGSFRECRAVIAAEAERLGLCHIDGLTLVPPMTAFFAGDGLHPTDNGFSILAENLIEQLKDKI